MLLLYKTVFIKMTIHVSKKTLKNFTGWYSIGLHKKKRYVVGIREQKELLAIYEMV